MLFKPIDYIFMTCITKFMLWLVGFQLGPFSSNFIRIIILLLSFNSENVIKFWAVMWDLGLKKWHKSRSCMHKSEEKSH